MTNFIILVVFAIFFGISFILFLAITVADCNLPDFPIAPLVTSIACLICCAIFMASAIHVWDNNPDCIQKQYNTRVKDIDDANKELQKFLIDHPELKMEEK